MHILTKNNLPDVVDLFSGCGGLSLGFHQAGFNIDYGVEMMENAAQNANYNLRIKYGRRDISAVISRRCPEICFWIRLAAMAVL